MSEAYGCGWHVEGSATHPDPWFLNSWVGADTSGGG